MMDATYAPLGLYELKNQAQTKRWQSTVEHSVAHSMEELRAKSLIRSTKARLTLSKILCNL